MTAKLSDWFEHRTRDNGERFYTLKDDRPEWLQEAVRAAHDDTPPDDWVYAECAAACEAIDSDYLTEDALSEYADGRVDVYTRDLYEWAHDMCLTSIYGAAEETAAELGDSSDTVSMSDRLMRIQYCAIEAIAGTMLRAYEQNKGDE